jgi:hypothetical protein
VQEAVRARVLDFVARARALRGEAFRNIEVVKNLAERVHAEALRRFADGAAARVPAPPAPASGGADGKRAAAQLRELREAEEVRALQAWAQRGPAKAYEEADVDAACNALLADAQVAFDDAARHVAAVKARGPLALLPAAGAEKSGTHAGEATATANATAAAPTPAAAGSGGGGGGGGQLPAFWAALAPGVGARLMQEFEGDLGAAKVLDLLDGKNPALRTDMKTQLAAANEKLSAGVKASEAQLEEMLASMLKEGKERIANMTEAFEDDANRTREQMRAAAGNVAEQRRLDQLLRETCMTVTQKKVSQRFCGICKRLDSADSGCGFGGASPQPFTRDLCVGGRAGTHARTHAQKLPKKYPLPPLNTHIYTAHMHTAKTLFPLLCSFVQTVTRTYENAA